MELVLAIVAGVLYATGLYLMLRRRLAQLIVGLSLMASGANVLIFTAAGLTRGQPPLVPEGATALPAPFADPVPQSLILTAIVIGFGVLAFSLVLAHRVHRSAATDDIDLSWAGTDVMLLVLPILIPLATAIVLSMMPQRPQLLRAVAFAGAVGILATAIAVLVRVEAGGIQVLQIGAWPAPFGITLVADLFSALLVAMVGVVAVVVTGHSFSGVDPRREAFGYHSLLHILLMGVSGAFLTGDIFNLYVWFEVMLIASFVLMALYRTRSQLHAAFTYVALNLLASALLLTAIGLLYGQAGTLNFADLARAWPERRTPALDAALSMLFVIAFGIKAGLFPLFFWLPASYHTPPAAIGALFAGLLTKVGVYALIRVFTLLFRDATGGMYTVVLALSATTMVVGMIAALGQRDFRRVLSFNLVGSHRLHHARAGAVDAVRTGGLDPLHAAPHPRHHEPVPRERSVSAPAPHHPAAGSSAACIARIPPSRFWP